MLIKLYEDKITKVYVDNNFVPDLSTWNILFHKYKNKKVQFKNKIYTVEKVLYHWNWGYYYSMCVSNGKIKFNILFKNVNCCVPKIMKIIDANSKVLTILNSEK